MQAPTYLFDNDAAHWYIDNTSGSDANDGQSAANAVQTWQDTELMTALFADPPIIVDVINGNPGKMYGSTIAYLRGHKERRPSLGTNATEGTSGSQSILLEDASNIQIIENLGVQIISTWDYVTWTILTSTNAQKYYRNCYLKYDPGTGCNGLACNHSGAGRGILNFENCEFLINDDFLSGTCGLYTIEFKDCYIDIAGAGRLLAALSIHANNKHMRVLFDNCVIEAAAINTANAFYTMTVGLPFVHFNKCTLGMTNSYTAPTETGILNITGGNVLMTNCQLNNTGSNETDYDVANVAEGAMLTLQNCAWSPSKTKAGFAGTIVSSPWCDYQGRTDVGTIQGASPLTSSGVDEVLTDNALLRRAAHKRLF